MPVHVHLLVDSGIHIIENLNLEELAASTFTHFTSSPPRCASKEARALRCVPSPSLL